MTKVTINAFDKILKKWLHNLTLYGKPLNLNQCPFYLTSENKIYFDSKNNLWTKPMEEVYKVLAQKANGTLFYVPEYSYYEGDEKKFTNISYLSLSFQSLKIGHIFDSNELNMLEFFVTYYDSFFAFIISPGELYTSYEKLYLPFDVDTWMFLFITFGCAFMLIFVINLMPKVIQNIVFGSDVRSPALNVITTFFGMGMTKLPSGNFGRIILTTFILFCLIIRTAYQGVQFEMLNSDMRRSHARTIQELIDKNFTIGFYNERTDYSADGDILALILGIPP
jgi:hypothetical protein